MESEILLGTPLPGLCQPQNLDLFSRNDVRVSTVLISWGVKDEASACARVPVTEPSDHEADPGDSQRENEPEASWSLGQR